VTLFDNGWLRFVVLPGFGLLLIALILFPHLYPISQRNRLFLGALGGIAVIMGGNRTSLVMAFIIILTAALVRGRTRMFVSLLTITVVALVSFHFIGEHLQFRRGVGFLRVLSLTSRRVAEKTDAAESIIWRKLRWQRAINEIRQNPFFGKGYGGLENAWLFSSMAEVESALVEVDLVSGGVHNGYLSAAYSLGIPAALIFAAALIAQGITSARRARRLAEDDPQESEFHAFVCGNLAAMAFAIYVGTDLNNPLLWFYMGFGTLLTRFSSRRPAEELSRTVAGTKPALLPGAVSA
jgi:O-antigen ligase